MLRLLVCLFQILHMVDVKWESAKRKNAEKDILRVLSTSGWSWRPWTSLSAGGCAGYKWCDVGTQFYGLACNPRANSQRYEVRDIGKIRKLFWMQLAMNAATSWIRAEKGPMARPSPVWEERWGCRNVYRMLILGVYVHFFHLKLKAAF